MEHLREPVYIVISSLHLSPRHRSLLFTRLFIVFRPVLFRVCARLVACISILSSLTDSGSLISPFLSICLFLSKQAVSRRLWCERYNLARGCVQICGYLLRHIVQLIPSSLLSISLSFVLFGPSWSWKVLFYIVLLLHCRIIDAGALDISRQIKYTIVLHIIQADLFTFFFRDAVSS
jgi:hypothetical protein